MIVDAHLLDDQPGDALAPEAFRDGIPWATFAALRNTSPVFRGRLPDGSPAWNLVRYDDVAGALKDWRTFEAPVHGVAVQPQHGHAIEHPGEPAWALKAMMAMNPPQHGPHRHRFVASLRSESVEAFRASARAVAEEAVAEAQDIRRFDAVEDFAARVAAAMVCEYLQIDRRNREHFRRLSAVFMADAFPPVAAGSPMEAALGPRSARAVSGSPARAAMDMVKDAWGPCPWLDRTLVDSADRWELEDLALQSFTAGVAGFRNCVATGMNLLGRRWEECKRDEQHWLQELPVVAEEVIRLSSPLLRARRLLSRDTIAHGVALEEGSTVLLWLAGANGDQRRFANPLQFLPFRRPNPHLSFGTGSHHCLGFGLARMELEEVLRAMLLAFRSVRIEAEPTYWASNVVCEMASLPVTITPTMTGERA